MTAHRIRRGAWAMLLIAPALLLSGAASAGTTIYEGNLIPGNYDALIPIVLKMEFEAGQVTGVGQAMMPGTTPLSIKGSKFGGACDITLHFATEQKAHLEGECSATRFEGQYTLYPPKGKGKVLGLFRLTGKKEKPKDAADEGQAGKEDKAAQIPGRSATACLKKKVACLGACPRGDYNAEFLCSNSCRRKEAACKGKGISRFQATPPSEPPVAAPEDKD